MRARRPRRFAFRPALDVLPQRLAPSGGLSLEIAHAGSEMDQADTGTTSIVESLNTDDATLQETDPTPLG